METTIKQKDGEQKRIGYFDTENKIWLVERNKNTHYMKLLKGWGLDSKIYDKLRKDYGLKCVHLTETKSNKIFECNVATIDEHKIYKTFHPHRLQIFIPKVFWIMVDDGKDR